MKKVLIICMLFLANFSFAKEFNLQKEIQKCQKCHGVKFDEQVLNVTKKIGTFSKKELISTFEKYIKGPSGGKPGLMKIILKKYNAKQRDMIADYIVKNH